MPTSTFMVRRMDAKLNSSALFIRAALFRKAKKPSNQKFQSTIIKSAGGKSFATAPEKYLKKNNSPPPIAPYREVCSVLHGTFRHHTHRSPGGFKFCRKSHHTKLIHADQLIQTR